MDWMVVDGAYPAFLERCYRMEPGLRDVDYESQLHALLAGRFGASDFYSSALGARGVSAVDVLLNASSAQRAWLRERGKGRLSRTAEGIAFFCRALEEQVREERPAVLLLLDMAALPDGFIRHLGQLVPVLVGQVAAPIDFTRDFHAYDLVVSSLPSFVDRFRQLGVRAGLLPLAFEPSLAHRVSVSRDLPVTFVGSLDADHGRGTSLINHLLDELPLQVWAPASQSQHLPRAHRSAYRGEAWGTDMYDVLGRSQIVVNRHIDVAEGFANNLRLFETTGMGACLVTESAPNLATMFVPGVEVVTYDSPQDCVVQVRRLLDDPERRTRIAAAGQARTLREHSYAARVDALLELVAELEPGKRSAAGRRWRSPALEGRAAVVRLARTSLRRARDLTADRGVSSGHRTIPDVGPEHPLAGAWTSESIPARQRRVADRRLRDLRRGEWVPEFAVAAEAVRATGHRCPELLEVGCASGYYAASLRLLEVSVAYTGVDYSLPLLRQAREHEPQRPFLAADGARLPFTDNAFDVVLSGCVLLHMPAWRHAVLESMRVARGHVILHRTPVTSQATTFLTKRAYGVEVVELVFNERELLAEVAALGGIVVREWVLDRYALEALSSPVEMKTYLIACAAT